MNKRQFPLKFILVLGAFFAACLDAAEKHPYRDAILCRNEWQPVCITVTNLGRLPLPFSVGIGRKIEPGPCTAGTVDIDLKLKVWPLRLPETSRMVTIVVKNAGIPEHIFSF